MDDARTPNQKRVPRRLFARRDDWSAIQPRPSVGRCRETNAVGHADAGPRVVHVESAIHDDHRRVIDVVNTFGCEYDTLRLPCFVVC